MNTASKTAAIALLLAAITGCTPKAKTPPQAQAPTITTGQGTPFPPPLTQPETKPATPPPPPPPVTTAEALPQPEPKPAPPKRTTHKKKPSTTTPPADTAPAPAPAQAAPAQTAQTPPSDQANTTQQAASGEPAAVSPIGTLSSGSESTGAQTRTQTVDLIHSTETGLNAIKRPLSTSEQETATKIRDFLVKARQALGVEDLDGAHTLANKAKVLLDELTKQ